MKQEMSKGCPRPVGARGLRPLRAVDHPQIGRPRRRPQGVVQHEEPRARSALRRERALRRSRVNPDRDLHAEVAEHRLGAPRARFAMSRCKSRSGLTLRSRGAPWALRAGGTPALGAPAARSSMSCVRIRAQIGALCAEMAARGRRQTTRRARGTNSRCESAIFGAGAPKTGVGPR